jgi:hypothetical protein
MLPSAAGRLMEKELTNLEKVMSSGRRISEPKGLKESQLIPVHKLKTIPAHFKTLETKPHIPLRSLPHYPNSGQKASDRHATKILPDLFL